MSLLNAVYAKILSLDEGTRDRLVLEFLFNNAVGHEKAVSGKKIVEHLESNGIVATKNDIQNGIVKESRSEEADFFIGSCRDGFFVIDTATDAKVMLDFYDTRIAAEQTNRWHLFNQTTRAGIAPNAPLQKAA